MNDTLITILVCAVLVSFGLNILCFQSIGFLKKDIRSIEKELWKTQLRNIKNRE